MKSSYHRLRSWLACWIAVTTLGGCALTSRSGPDEVPGAGTLWARMIDLSPADIPGTEVSYRALPGGAELVVTTTGDPSAVHRRMKVMGAEMNADIVKQRSNCDLCVEPCQGIGCCFCKSVHLDLTSNGAVLRVALPVVELQRTFAEIARKSEVARERDRAERPR